MRSILLAAAILLSLSSNLLAQDIFIVCRWGEGGKNQLNTKHGTLTRDMGDLPPVVIRFELSPEEKRSIFEAARKMGFFSFPHELPDSLAQNDQNHDPETGLVTTPRPTCRNYFVSIETPSETNWVDWNECLPPRAPWIKHLRRLHKTILAIIEDKPVYKALPYPFYNDVIIGLPCR